MKFTERMQLIKAGYTKKEIAEMEKDLSASENGGNGSDDRLDLIAQAVAKLTDDFHEMNIRNDASGNGGGEEPDIWEKLRASLAGEDPNKDDEGGNK